MPDNILWNAKEYVSKLLLPLESYYYHTYNHALDVMQRAMYIAKKEWLNDEEIEILWIAGLFHDTWFIIQYDNNEPIWAKIAQNYLKSILYPKEKIELIENIILATSLDYKNPKNIYEKIIKDADLDNLWRDDFIEKWNNLKKELELVKQIKIKDPDWIHWSIKLLEEHRYQTKTQEKERAEKKENNLKKLEWKLEDSD
jgi:HD superfamily phosphodiesterase